MGFLKGLIKTITGIIAVIICIVIFVLEIGIHLVVDTRGYLSKDNIVDMVKEVDIDTLLEDENGVKTDLAKNIYDSALEAGVSNKTIDKILESESLREFVGEYIGSSVASILYGTDVKKPTSEDITNLVKDNMHIVEEIALSEGKILTEEDKQEILDTIKNEASEIIAEIPDIKTELNQDSEEVINVIQNVYDTKYLLYATGAIIVLVALIALLRFNLYSWMMWLSIPTMISSIIMIGLSLVHSLLTTVLKSLEISKNIVDLITNNLLGSLFTRFLISGIIGFVISILLIVFYSIINGKKKSKITQSDNSDMAVL